MTIQDTIIDTLKATHSALSRALATVASLRSEKAALEAERARLNSQVAHLKSHIAHLEAECSKIVEPSAVQSLLASVLQIVEEAQQATLSPHTAQAPGAVDALRQNETTQGTLLGRPMRGLQRRDTDRDELPETLDAAQ